ncbi:hypothetical protein [Methanosarcina mazei]
MGLEIVVKDIQEGARAEVSRIKAEGDAKASEIINEAKEIQKKTLGDSLAKAEEDLQSLHQQVISSANLEVKRINFSILCWQYRFYWRNCSGKRGQDSQVRFHIRFNPEKRL